MITDGQDPFIHNHNAMLAQDDVAPEAVRIVPDAMAVIESLPGVQKAVGTAEAHAAVDQEIAEYSKYKAFWTYLGSFRHTASTGAVGDVHYLARALETLAWKPNSKVNAGRAWTARLALSETMKESFGVLDAGVVEELRTAAATLGTNTIEGKAAAVKNAYQGQSGQQWTKSSRYVRLAELTEDPDDTVAALATVQRLVTDIRERNGARLAGEVPYTVDALYRLGQTDTARQLVVEYLEAKNPNIHYVLDTKLNPNCPYPLINAAYRTQDRAELELALQVIEETTGPADTITPYQKGLRTEYGTLLADAARELGAPDIALAAAELISNPVRRERVLGRLAIRAVFGS